MWCDWTLTETNHRIRLSTMSYSFDEYVVDNYQQSKSILSEHHLSLSSAVRVTSLHYFDDPSTPSGSCTCSFTNIRHLVTAIPCWDSLLALIPMLDQLSSLPIDRFVGENVHAQLPLILDRATRLRRLTFSNCEHFETQLLGVKSQSIRELSFSSYFSREECVQLAASSLDKRCHSLVVELESLECITALVDLMPHLRSLPFSYYKYLKTIEPVGRKLPDLFDWLGTNFPGASWYARRPEDFVLILGWIRWSNNGFLTCFCFIVRLLTLSRWI